MIPLMIAGAIWGSNLVKIAHLASRKRQEAQRREIDDSDPREKLLEIQNEFMRPESKSPGINFNNCTFNIYIKGGSNGRERFID